MAYQPTYEDLLAIIDELRVTIARLEAELAQYRTPKNSSNTHLPPSGDLVSPARNQSLRQKSDKKQGGQQGHTGTTLQIKVCADEIIDHTPCYCRNCGKDLSAIAGCFIEGRQVVDLPPIQPVYTEHRVYSKTCTCGHTTQSDFPPAIHCSLQYGSNAEALAAYLHARQYLPYKRMAEFFDQALNLPVSTATMANMVQRFADKSDPVYQQIKARIEHASCLGSDETGVKVNGKRHWLWTWQNERLTYIVHAQSRGYSTIEEHFPGGLPDSIVVHDRWAAQLKCPAGGHQLCLAHVLRDLNYVAALYQSRWAIDLKELLREAIALKSEALVSKGCLPQRSSKAALNQKLELLLAQSLPWEHHKALSLQKELKKHKGYLLVFLDHEQVPADNNGSERAIRNVKVKQKVSGQYKTPGGAKAFCKIRSVIDTVIKSGQHVLHALALIAISPAPE